MTTEETKKPTPHDLARQVNVHNGIVEARIIPRWATHIIVHPIGIDGWAPDVGRHYHIDRFMSEADALQLKQGSGEWEVSVWAVSDGQLTGSRAPYGKDHPMRYPRSGRKGQKVKHVGTWSYMRWSWLWFVKE